VRDPSDSSSTKLLAIMVAAVPVIVAVAGLVVSGLLPFLATLIVVAAPGVFLARTAGRSRERGDGRNRDGDGV